VTPPASEPDGKTPSVTWFGHATAVAELGNARVLFDPLFRSRTRRAGKVDAVLVTHSHVDHLNRWSLKAVDRDTHLIVPKGAKDIVADLGFRQLTEMDVGDEVEINGAQVTAVGTRHDHGRWRKSHAPVALGYVVRGGGAALHHGGDIDFSDHAVFNEIGKHHEIDATLLPIGGMLPVWYYRRRRESLDTGVHIDPDCALDIYERLGAKALIPVHWGTVNLRLGLPSMPRRRLAKIAGERSVGGVQILAHRETWSLTPRRGT
jgi:L-ascorbate metabolism protein UlaG (beta-lactamase superfamily)